VSFSGRKRRVWEQLFPKLFPNFLGLFQRCRPFLTPLTKETHRQPKICRRFVTTRKRLLKETSVERLLSITGKRAAVRARHYVNSGIHPQVLKKALRRGLLVKIDRGLYTSRHNSLNFQHQVMLTCKRVPRGVVCLESALMFNGVAPTRHGPIWIAIDRKARKPVVKGLQLQFVRYSGQALTQGVINMRIDGEPIRVYSVAKTIADCFKYRRKIGVQVAIHAFQESIRLNKCSCERLLHFADMCRVGKLVRAAHSIVPTRRSASGVAPNSGS
jgi:predicted transcriptional regulator of viral defense system